MIVRRKRRFDVTKYHGIIFDELGKCFETKAFSAITTAGSSKVSFVDQIYSNFSSLARFR